MNFEAYRAVRRNSEGAGFAVLARALLKVKGRDRAAFLQGQLSNDILALKPGDGIRACLLNNTGHLLGDLVVYAFADYLMIETDLQRIGIVKATLERFLIREKVTFEDVTDRWVIVTVAGSGATQVCESLLEMPIVFSDAPKYSHTPIPVKATDGDEQGVLVKCQRVDEVDCYDLWLPSSASFAVTRRLSVIDGVSQIDDDTFEVLRVESASPKWGAELSEAYIALEAELEDAISYTKGCYMGQEIIARIHSRGHTNRSLRFLQLDRAAHAGDPIVAVTGPRKGQEVGQITSAVLSPLLGPCALAYLRNEYADGGEDARIMIERGSLLHAPVKRRGMTVPLGK